MKTSLLNWSFLLVCSVLPTISQAKVVTLSVSAGKTTDSISIGTNEVARIVTFHNLGGYSSAIYITTGGTTNVVYSDVLNSGSAYVVAGPARIELRYQNGPNSFSSFSTIEVEPESFPPDKTLIIPADTKGANIIMEASSDLIHWTNSVPGLYTNISGNLFFRIRADRIP